MSKPVLRGEPACERGCPDCTIRCAVVVGMREGALEDIERLRRSGKDPEALAEALERFDAAERGFQHVVPRGGRELPAPTARSSGLVH
jgi:hypothetical protein